MLSWEQAGLRIALVYHLEGCRRRKARVDALARVLRARGHRLTCHDSLAFDCANEAPDAELLCIAGGDGTVRLVLDSQKSLTGLPPVAIYPAGSVNLLARELGYPRSPRAFAGRIERAVGRRSSRVAAIGQRHFLACASMGVDALAVARVSLALKARIGRFAYLDSILRLLQQWPRHRLLVAADGEEFEAEALFLLRGAHYAGPFTLDRRAGLDRDKLHVLALPRACRRDVLGLALYAICGARYPAKDWRFLQVSELQVRAEEPVPVQADGDVLTSTPVDIRMTEQRVLWA